MIRIIQLAAFAAALAGGAAFAQNGTTSGPAAGSPTTLGTGGQSSGIPKAANPMRNAGGPAIKREQEGQAGGTPGLITPGAESGRPKSK